MVLKVTPEELLDVSDVMKKDAEVYTKEIEKMQQNLEKLKTIWQGEDARVFCENVDHFIVKMKTIPLTLNTFSKICNESSDGYKTRDEQFAKNLEREAVENDG